MANIRTTENLAQTTFVVHKEEDSNSCLPLDLLDAGTNLLQRQDSSVQPVRWPGVYDSLISSVSSRFASVSFHFLSFAALLERVVCTLLDLLDMANFFWKK